MRLDALQRIFNQTLPLVDPDFRGDANETLVFARQLEHVYATAYEIEYPESAGRRLIPINTSVSNAASSYVYRMVDEYGEAELIDSYAMDLPNVEGTGKEYTGKLVSAGASFFVSIQDLREAAKAGIQLEAKKALTARKAMDRWIDKMLCKGDSLVSMTGFANNANVPLISPTTGTWSTASAANIQGDVEKLAKSIFTATLGLHGNPDNGSGLTLAVAPSHWAKLASTRVDTFNMMTLLEYLQSRLPFVKEITSWNRLETADAAGTGPRIVAYHKDPDVVEGIISQEFEMLPPQPKSLGYSVPCHARMGGVKVVYPKAMAYMDGC